jgi:hypothetical protein
MIRTSKIDIIGTGSVLTKDDADHLTRLGTKLYNEGRYTMGLYLHALVEHSEIKDGKKEN